MTRAPLDEYERVELDDGTWYVAAVHRALDRHPWVFDTLPSEVQEAINALVAATPAPLDVPDAEEAVYAALLYINQRIPRPRAARALMDALRQDGYEVRRVTLAATPAPLDVLVAAKAVLPENATGRAVPYDALRRALAATPAPLDVCPSCGRDGLPPNVCERCGHRWYATPAADF